MLVAALLLMHGRHTFADHVEWLPADSSYLLSHTQCKNAMRKLIISPTCILLIVSVALAVFAPYTLTIKLAAIASCHATWGFVLYFRPEGESPIEGRGQRLLWWSTTLLHYAVTLAMSVAGVLVLMLCHQHTPGWIIAAEVGMNGVIVPHATINCGSGIQQPLTCAFSLAQIVWGVAYAICVVYSALAEYVPKYLPTEWPAWGARGSIVSAAGEGITIVHVGPSSVVCVVSYRQRSSCRICDLAVC
jgi:hypothetical protein